MVIEAPKPIVKVPSKKGEYGKVSKTKKGRGFSKGEVKAIGLTLYEARKLGIYIDKRRKTVYEENIEKLKKWVDYAKQHSEEILSTFPKKIIVKRDLRRVFKGKTAVGRRVRGLLTVKYRYTHNYKWKKKNLERKRKKRHEAIRHKGGH